MGKYDKLHDYLQAFEGAEMEMRFNEIEKVLGFALPQSAYIYPAWWSNNNQSNAQARSWLTAGYHTRLVNIPMKSVVFQRKGSAVQGVLYMGVEKETYHRNHFGRKNITESEFGAKEAEDNEKCSVTQNNADVLYMHGYPFRFIQTLIPKIENGEIMEHRPQERFVNIKNIRLSENGSGTFCWFTIKAPESPGVYLWIADNETIYVGETENLRKRFNLGYGNISPRNCYEGGQSTNCKMNKVVMEYYKVGKPVKLYFYETEQYKQVEREILSDIVTKYNKRVSSKT